MAKFAVPDMPTEHVTRYQKFRGVDFSTDPALVDASRSPFAPNLISDAGGMPEKRLGWRTLLELPQGGKVNGMWWGTIQDKEVFLCHCGTALYKWEQTVYGGGQRIPYGQEGWTPEGTATLLKEGIHDGPSSAFEMDGKIYILTGGEYLVYGEFPEEGSEEEEPPQVVELRNVADDAYIPTTRIGAKPDGGEGVSFEEVNLLTGARKNGFVADGSATEYTLDAQELDEGAVTAEVNGTEITEGDGLSVDREKGKVTFATAPSKGDVPGKDNVIITFHKAGKDYLQKVLGCNVAVLYADRVFITGNPKEPNTDWRSSFQDPTYFPDLGYTKVGSETPIMGYAKIGEYLAIVKEDSSQDSTVFLRMEDTLNGQTVFPVKQGVTGAGAVAARSFGQILGEPLFLSRNGVLGLVSSSVTDEKAVQNRSYYIDSQLLREENLENAIACSWDGNYLLGINNKAYILDGRQAKSYKSQSMGDYLFECYQWENIPAVCWMEHNNELYFGTADGRICRFNSDMDTMARFSDDGQAIVCAWSTKADDDGNFTQYKNLLKRGCGVMIKPYLRSSVKILVRTQRDFGNQIRYSTMDIFDWEDIDFERFTFSSNDAPQVVPFNRKVKKYITLQITVRNDAANEGFGVFGIIKKFTKGNSVK